MAGGVRVVATYARLFQERGHDIHWISIPSVRAQSHRQKLLTRLGLRKPLPPIPRSDFADFLGDRHTQIEPGRAIEARDVPDADVTIATWWETAEWVNAFPASKGRKVYLIQDYEVFPHMPQERVAATYGFAMQKIAVSNYIRDTIQKQHEVTGDIAVIPNAVDLQQFQAPEREKSDGLTVGFMYSAAPRKNVGLAIEAVARLKAEMPALKVMAFGSKVPLEDLALPGWIEYQRQPPQKALAGIYASCDVWLFPTESEGFGLPLLEAMACRTPVLATDAGAAPQLINGRNGQILDHDADAFVAGMRAFAAMDRDTWRAASRAAYETVLSHTWEDAADQFLEIVAADKSV